MTEERVLVIPANVMHEAIGDAVGFIPFSHDVFESLTQSERMFFLGRSRAECDPSFKQLIPYCILESKDQHGIPHYLQYTRGGGQGETRLHARKSVGIGGHINSDDIDGYLGGMARELHEEVNIVGDYWHEPIGFIYDDSNDVGRVHLGVVHLVHLSGNAEPAESEMLDAGFSSLDDLLATHADFEMWSQLCIHHLARTAE